MGDNNSGARPSDQALPASPPEPFGLSPSGNDPSRYVVAPITGKAAIAWIAHTHRHLPKLQGALFAVAVSYGDQLVGVATAGNPPRVWQGTGRVVITRCAARTNLPTVGNHAAPVCTMLYGAICQAAKALGYSEAWTYTLPGEPGTSLRAAGFRQMGLTRAEEWDRPSRRRTSAVCAASKQRWMRRLRTASVDTRPQGRDAQQARFTSGAVPKADAEPFDPNLTPKGSA